MSSNDIPNYGEHSGSKPSADKLQTAMQQLAAMVAEAQKYEREIVAAELQVKAAKDKLHAVVEDALPNAMIASGMTIGNSIDFGDQKVTLKHKVNTSVTKANKEAAMDWLQNNGHSDIIKREVTVVFGVSEGDIAAEVAKRLQKELARTVVCGRKAEPATVKSIITKRLANNQHVPLALFSVYERDISEIKTVKGKSKAE